MSTKQKITLSVLASFMGVVIIGLTIAVVLVANMVSTTATMKITFTSYEVDATIASHAYVVKDAVRESDITGSAGTIVTDDGVTHPTIKTPEDGVITFDAGEEFDINNPKMLEFDEFTLSNHENQVRYEFTITNTSNKVIQTKFMFATLADNMIGYVVCDAELVTEALEDGKKVVYYNLAHNEQITINYLIYPEDPSKDGEYSENEGGFVQINLNGDSNTFVTAS